MILDKVLFLLNSIIIQWECWNYDNLCCSMNVSHWLIFDMWFLIYMNCISTVLFFSRACLVNFDTAYVKE